VSGSTAIHAMYAPRLVRGVAQTRELRLLDASGTVAVGNGTYTLLGPDGVAVDGCDGITVTAGVTASITPPSTLTLGAGYVELWSVAIDGLTAIRTIDVLVQTWALTNGEVLASAYHALQRYPTISLLMASAAGQTSWDGHAQIATARVMADLDARMTQYGGATVARTRLFWPAIDALCAEIYRTLGANGNASALAMAELHEAAYTSWWTSLVIPVDTDGDGAADTQRTATPAATPGAGSL